MQDIFEYFRTNRKAKAFSKFRSGTALSFSDYVWLMKDAAFFEFPKAIILSIPTGIGSKLRFSYFKGKLAKIGKKLNIRKEFSYNWRRKYFDWLLHLD